MYHRHLRQRISTLVKPDGTRHQIGPWACAASWVRCHRSRPRALRVPEESAEPAPHHGPRRRQRCSQQLPRGDGKPDVSRRPKASMSLLVLCHRPTSADPLVRVSGGDVGQTTCWLSSTHKDDPSETVLLIKVDGCKIQRAKPSANRIDTSTRFTRVVLSPGFLEVVATSGAEQPPGQT
jgi:hypothetical protein